MVPGFHHPLKYHAFAEPSGSYGTIPFWTCFPHTRRDLFRKIVPRDSVGTPAEQTAVG